MPGFDAVLFFAGGALTLAAGLVAEWYRDNRRTTLVQLVKLGLRDDLKRAIASYDELIKIYLTSDYVSFADTQAIQDSRAAYDRNRDAILLLDDALRESVVIYYQHSSQTISGLVNAQQRRESLKEASGG